MAYVPTILVIAFVGWLMWWSHIQDKKQHPGHSLRGDFEGLFSALKEMTLRDAVVLVWKLSLYLVCLLLFFTALAIFGITGPLCWRC